MSTAAEGWTTKYGEHCKNILLIDHFFQVNRRIWNDGSAESLISQVARLDDIFLAKSRLELA
jgi:hypothetical protein